MASNIDTTIAELLRSVESDPHAAAELLARAADFLKRRDSMPDALADYLASAFRYAASTPQQDSKRIEDERIARLATALGMTREAGRPRKRLPKRALIVIAVHRDTASETALANALHQGTKRTDHQMSIGTARSRIKETKMKLAEADERTRQILESGKPKTAVRQR